VLHEEMSVGPSKASSLSQGSRQQGTNLDGRLHFLYLPLTCSAQGCLATHSSRDSWHANALVQCRDSMLLPWSCLGSVVMNGIWMLLWEVRYMLILIGNNRWLAWLTFWIYDRVRIMNILFNENVFCKFSQTNMLLFCP